MTTHKTLVAGIGNIFNSDDGFGVEVAQLLTSRPPVDGVRVEDYGIRGVHLALELLEGYDLLVLVDAIASGEPPGTLVLLEPTAVEHTPDAETTGPPGAHRLDHRGLAGTGAAR